MQRARDQVLERLAQRGVEGVGDRERRGSSPSRATGITTWWRAKGARERLRDQVVVDLAAGRSSGRGRRTRRRAPRRSCPRRSCGGGASGWGSRRDGDDLGGRDVVARGRLRAHRADLLLQHAAAQRRRARARSPGGLLGEQRLARTSSSSSFVEPEGRARVGRARTRSPRAGRGRARLGAHARLPLPWAGLSADPPKNRAIEAGESPTRGRPRRWSSSCTATAARLCCARCRERIDADLLERARRACGGATRALGGRDPRASAPAAAAPRATPTARCCARSIYQQLAGAAARAIAGRLRGRFGGRYPAPGPAARRAGRRAARRRLSRQKVATLRAVASGLRRRQPQQPPPAPDGRRRASSRPSPGSRASASGPPTCC